MLSPVRSASKRAVTSSAPDSPRVPAHHSNTTSDTVITAITEATVATTRPDSGCIGGFDGLGCGMGELVTSCSSIHCP